MTQHTGNWQTRYSTMGDIAEASFETWATDQGIRWARYGLNRPDPSMARWNAFIRYTPDYIVHNAFWEVKGCGRDGLLKIKQENIEALREWSDHLPVWMYCYNSHTQENVTFHLDQQFLMWLGMACEHDRFHDNNKVYWKIPWHDLKEQTWNQT